MDLPGNRFYFSCSGPYRAISASISFKRSSPLLPGRPTPGPGTTGPPATGSPGAGPAPAITDAVAFTAPLPPPQILRSSPWLLRVGAAADVWTSATDALRDAVGPGTGANEMWPHPQEEHKPIRVPEGQGPEGPCSCQSAAERAGHALRVEGGEWERATSSGPARCESRSFEEARKFGGPSRSLSTLPSPLSVCLTQGRGLLTLS